MKKLISVLRIYLMSMGIVIFTSCSINEITKVKCAVPPKQEGDNQKINPEMLLSDEKALCLYEYWYKKLELNKGLEDLAAKYRKPTISSKRYDNDYKKIVFEIIGPANTKMSLDGITGNILFIYSHPVNRVSHALPKKVEPEKTEQEIIRQAQKYRDMIAGDIIKNYTLSEPKVEFNNYGTFRGKWDICWYRQINGYKFEKDAISMSISDKYGLAHFLLYLSSEPCPTEVKITETQAKKIALAFAPKAIEKWRRHFPVPGDVTIYGINNCKLRIINPTYCFSPEVTSLWQYFHNRKTRLAYRIGINWLNRKSKLYPSFYIDVDAETGEIVGGAVPQ